MELKVNLQMQVPQQPQEQQVHQVKVMEVVPQELPDQMVPLGQQEIMVKVVVQVLQEKQVQKEPQV